MLTVLLLSVLTQGEVNAPADSNATAEQAPQPAPPARARVHLESNARSVRLVERATNKTACEAPCDVELPTGDQVEYQLVGSGDALPSDAFTLQNLSGAATVRWRAASGASRGFGVALIILGGLSVLSAIAVGIASLSVGLSCTSSGAACPRFDWAWSALPLGLGGYVAIGFGLPLTFRFGIERISVESGN